MAKASRTLVLMLAAVSIAAAQPKSLFYMTRNPQSVNSFLEHFNKIDILVPMWYRVDETGMLWGGPDPLVLKTAKEHNVELMPIVTGFRSGSASLSDFVKDSACSHSFIRAMVRDCRTNGYSGFQFDFEHLKWTESGALSELVKEAANALHEAGYKLTIATIPNAPGYPGQTEFDYWLYRDWQGVYNLKELSKYADMICLMTYDQHTSFTPPGPVAGYPWTVENLKYALEAVPKAKLMLGIPLYGYHWFAGPPPEGKVKQNIEAREISEPDAMQLAKAYGGDLQWDQFDRTSWFYFYRDNMREWVFFTDTRTFKARYDLVEKSGIEGFCSWVLGAEDPGIWEMLPSHH